LCQAFAGLKPLKRKAFMKERGSQFARSVFFAMQSAAPGGKKSPVC
jgi:hypothetical protein